MGRTSDYVNVTDAGFAGCHDEWSHKRAGIVRLAWDFAGTVLAGRNEQYERCYLGPASRNLIQAHQRSDRAGADRLVDRFLREKV